MTGRGGTAKTYRGMIAYYIGHWQTVGEQTVTTEQLTTCER